MSGKSKFSSLGEVDEAKSAGGTPNKNPHKGMAEVTNTAVPAAL